MAWEQRLPPTLFWSPDGGDRNAYSSKDLLLLEAYDLYQRGLCSCGHPAWLAHDQGNLGEFRVTTVECLACKAAEDDQTKYPAGTKTYVSHDLFNPNRLPSKRGRRRPSAATPKAKTE